MKIILSRKGFDSSYGGRPSPILPDGRIVSLPIPWEKDSLTYADLKLGIDGYPAYSDLMASLGISLKDPHCHLDPDLIRSTKTRNDGWKQTLGQMGAAQSHLDNQGVKEDDLFLFFGRFNHTQYEGNKIVFKKKCQDFHMIFGYLQIGEIKRVNSEADVYEWMKEHPHANSEYWKDKKNTIFIARDTLSWNEKIPGAGIFKFREELVLTKPGHSISHWDLPDIFKKVRMSCHSDKSWKDEYFQSVSRGQEFVIREDEMVKEWAKGLIEKGGGGCPNPTMKMPL